MAYRVFSDISKRYVKESDNGTKYVKLTGTSKVVTVDTIGNGTHNPDGWVQVELKPHSGRNVVTGHSLKWPWQQRVTIKDDEPPSPPKTGPLAEVDASIPNWKREEWYDPWKRYHGRGTFTVPEGSPTTYRITLSERVTRENPLTLKYSVWQDGDFADSKYIGSHAVTLRWSPTPREQKRSEVPSDYTPPDEYTYLDGIKSLNGHGYYVEITIQTIDDDVDETFFGSLTLRLKGGDGYRLGRWNEQRRIQVVHDNERPVVSVSAEGDVTEGENAVFAFTADPTPWRDQGVQVTITKTGDFGVDVSTTKIVIPTSGSYKLTLPTDDDSVVEENGWVTVTLDPVTWGDVNGYDRSPAAYEATVNIADNDSTQPPPTPEVSVTVGSGVTEGGNASFTVTASPAPSAPLSVNVSVGQQGDFGATTGSQTVTIPTSGSATVTVGTTDDDVDETDGSVSVTANAGDSYTISSTQGTASASVADNDDPPPTPQISVTAGSGITEGGNASFTVTASPAPSAPLSVNVTVRQDGDFAATTGPQTVSISTSGSVTLSIPTIDDGADGGGRLDHSDR